jgi:hypothetical protein
MEKDAAKESKTDIRDRQLGLLDEGANAILDLVSPILYAEPNLEMQSEEAKQLKLIEVGANTVLAYVDYLNNDAQDAELEAELMIPGLCVKSGALFGRASDYYASKASELMCKAIDTHDEEIQAEAAEFSAKSTELMCQGLLLCDKEIEMCKEAGWTNGVSAIKEEKKVLDGLLNLQPKTLKCLKDSINTILSLVEEETGVLSDEAQSQLDILKGGTYATAAGVSSIESMHNSTMEVDAPLICSTMSNLLGRASDYCAEKGDTAKALELVNMGIMVCNGGLAICDRKARIEDVNIIEMQINDLTEKRAKLTLRKNTELL